MISIHVRGGRDVGHILRVVGPRDAFALTRSTVGALTSEVMRDAKKNMNFTGPYSVGLMKRSTRKRVRRVRNGVFRNDIIVLAAAFYWRFYEYGDGHNPRRRMFGNTLIEFRPKLKARWRALFMDKFIRRMQRARNGPLAGTGRGR